MANDQILLQRIDRMQKLVTAIAEKLLGKAAVNELLGETPRPKTPEHRRGAKGPTTGGVRGLDDLTRRRD